MVKFPTMPKIMMGPFSSRQQSWLVIRRPVGVARLICVRWWDREPGRLAGLRTDQRRLPPQERGESAYGCCLECSALPRNLPTFLHNREAQLIGQLSSTKLSTSLRPLFVVGLTSTSSQCSPPTISSLLGFLPLCLQR